nr:MAG: putative polyprotein [Picornavirales sp.]
MLYLSRLGSNIGWARKLGRMSDPLRPSNLLVEQNTTSNVNSTTTINKTEQLTHTQNLSLSENSILSSSEFVVGTQLATVCPPLSENRQRIKIEGIGAAGNRGAKALTDQINALRIKGGVELTSKSIQDIKEFCVSTTAGGPMLEDMVKGLVGEFTITKQMILDWRREGCLQTVDKYSMEDLSDVGPIILPITSFMRDGDRWITAALHRAVAGAQYLSHKWHTQVYLSLNRNALVQFKRDADSFLNATHIWYRVVCARYRDELVPVETSRYFIEAFERFAPHAAFEVFDCGVSTGIYNAEWRYETDDFTLVDLVYAYGAALRAVATQEECQYVLMAVDTPCARPQGVVGGLWDLLTTAWSGLKNLIEGGTKAVAALVRPFLKKLVESTFSALVQDWYPMNAIASVIGVLNSIFSPIAQAFGDLFSILDSEETPSGFMEAMNTGSTCMKITRWTLGAVSFALLAWIMQRMAIFTQTTLVHIIESVHSVLSGLFGAHVAQPFVSPQGPENTCVVNVIGTVITLVLALFTNVTNLHIVQRVTKFFSGLPTLHRGVTEALASVIALLPAGLAQMCAAVSTNPRDALYSDMFAWILDSTAVLTASTSLPALADAAFQERVRDVYAQGTDLAAKYVKVNTGGGAVFPELALFNNNIGKLNSLNAKMMAMNAIQAGRPEPVFLMVYGKAGSGKSMFGQFIPFMFRGVRGYNGRKHESVVQVYNKALNDPFYSGLQQDQYPVCVFDEIWRDAGSTDPRKIDMQSELLDIISETPFMPPMPALDVSIAGSKGTTFNSTLVIGMYNHALPAQITVEPEALVRRLMYTYEIVPPTFDNLGRCSTKPRCAFFMLRAVDYNNSALPNELKTRRPGFYMVELLENDVPDWESAVEASCDHLMYAEMWRFRRNMIYWRDSQVVEVPESGTVSCAEMVETVLDAVDLRVARFLKVLARAGLRFRTDFNAFVDKMRTALLTSGGETEQTIQDLFSSVQFEIDDFMCKNLRELQAQMDPKVLTIDDMQEVQRDLTAPDEVMLHNEAVEAQFGSRKRKHVLVRTRAQANVVEQADMPITAAVLSLIPEAPQDDLQCNQGEFQNVAKQRSQQLITDNYPWLIDLVEHSESMYPETAVCCQFKYPDEVITKAYPAMKYAQHRNVIYEYLWRSHPNSEEYIKEKNEQYGFTDKVCILHSKYPTDGKYKFCLIVCGDAIANVTELFMNGFALPSKERWYAYTDTCPVHFINFWNDKKHQVEVEDGQRYALNAVRDLIISDPVHDRLFYPPVLAKCSSSMLDVVEAPVAGCWSYCTSCLRFFPPGVFPTPNVCLCGGRGAEHTLVWLTDKKASDNLKALAAAIPSMDYMYFCAMAANLLWMTSTAKWDGFVKIYQNRLRHTTYESISRMINALAPSKKYLRLVENNQTIDTDYDEEDQYKGFDTEMAMLASRGADYSNPFISVPEAANIATRLAQSKHSIGYWFIVGAAIVGSLGVVLRAVSRLFSKSDEVADDFSPESAMPRTIARVKNDAVKPAKTNARKMSAIGAKNTRAQGPDTTVTECMISLDGSPFVRGFIPMGNYCFTYIHGLAKYLGPEAQEFVISVDEQQIKFAYDPDCIAVDTDHDLLCIYIPPRAMYPKRDMLRLFPGESDLASGVGVTAFLRIDRRDYIATTALMPHVEYNVESQLSDFAHYHHAFAYSYPIQTHAGDCGSLLRCLDGILAGKIIGFHVAAAKGGMSRTVGVAAPLYRELLMDLIQAITPEASSKALRRPSDDLEIVENLDVVQVQGPPQKFCDRLADLSGPNLVSMSSVPPVDRVNVPVKSSYHPTVFADDARFQGKYPSIMQPVEAGDPAFNAFQELAGIETPEIDQDRLVKVADQQLGKLKETLKFYGAGRELTFKEAVAGIPGLLSSLRLSTSAGYPLTLMGTKGKTSFVQILPNGEVRVSRFFYERVMNLVKMLREHDESVFERYPFYWLAFMKDELRPLKKIKNVATRMIYCNSLEWMTAGRMLFGGLQVAFNNNAGNSIFSAGINVNSHDLQSIADYLGQVSLERCIAGDYSGFDKHYHPDFQRAAYANMRELGKSMIRGFDAEAFDMFVRHELSPDVQFGDVRMKFRHSHFSGCFFTTAENCLVNELYFMYCFDTVYPDKEWCEETRFVALGDDHLVACSENIPNFNARSVCELMKTIGQVYTDENKCIPDYDYKPFTECGFLGSTPKLRYGRYVGALRLETLYSNLSHITKDTDFNQLIETFLDMASIYDEDVFNKYLNDINSVWSKVSPQLFNGSYIARQQKQVRRTAESGAGFWKPEGESDATPYWVCGQALHQPTHFVQRRDSFHADQVLPQGPGDFTQIQGEEVHASNVPKSDSVDPHRAVGVDYASLTSPTQSPMYLTSFEWSSTDPANTLKLSLNLPGDAIKQAMQQTVPFQYYRYWHGDVELTFQVNGNNFQAGALVAALCPLKAKAAAGISRANYLTGEHCILEPRQSTSCTLRVPYRYYTDVMGTDGAINSKDILGSVLIYVLSPLLSSSSTTVTVTVLVSFPNSQFYGPTTMQAIAQGPDGLSVDDLVGLIPGSSVVTKPIRKLNQLLDTKFIPMDNTPVYNGSVPTANQFPGVSSVVGAKAAVKPTLNPTAFYRKTEKIFEPGETKVASMCAREGIIRDFQWSTSVAPGSSLLQIPLNSICSDLPAAKGQVIQLPVNLCVLNMFMYWHADLEFKLYVFKTPFHSGRLRVSLSLTNQPDKSSTSEALQNQNMLFNQVLDYSNAETCSFVVPFTAAREFLYTAAESDNATTDKIGYLNIVVLNRLVTSTATVSPTVNCMLTVSLKNTRVAVPHPVPPVSFSGSIPSITVQAQGPEEGAATVEDPAPIPVSFGDPVEASEQPSAPGELMEDSHFAYAVEDLMELARRLEPFPLNRATGTNASVNVGDNVWYSTMVYPAFHNMFYDLFMGYSGGMRIRVIGSPMLYSYIPECVMGHNNMVPATMLMPATYAGGTTYTWTMSSGQKVNTSTNIANFTATEMAYPLPDGQYYIDIEVPYEVPTNFYGPFNLIYYHTVQVEPYRPALILTSTDKAITGVAFMGAADDGLFGIYCPPQNSYFWWKPADASLAVGALD